MIDMPAKGTNMTAEHRAKISAALFGNKNGIGNKGRSGRPLSEEQKLFLKERFSGPGNPNYGKKFSAEHRAKLVENHADHSGKNHYNYGKRGEEASGWKADELCVTPQNRRIRRSMRYMEWRYSVFERDNWTCQLCGVRCGTLNAHHVKYFSKHSEFRFCTENGKTLCVACHMSFHGKNHDYTATQ